MFNIIISHIFPENFIEISLKSFRGYSPSILPIFTNYLDFFVTMKAMASVYNKLGKLFLKYEWVGRVRFHPQHMEEWPHKRKLRFLFFQIFLEQDFK